MIHTTPIPGVIWLEPEPIHDERGFFAQLWQADSLQPYGVNTQFVRTNLSSNPKRGTLRGLHGQANEAAEDKLVICLSGAIFDVAVDLRKDSPTYLRWFGLALNGQNHRMLYIPKGCVHGYQTLDNNSEVLYWVTGTYQPQAEIGVRWNDPAIGIVWPPAASRLISEKDQNWPLLEEEFDLSVPVP
jgi:dTDP-4-dehydrorhamnose 3,5-epimerase